jgi:hypothetical protein
MSIHLRIETLTLSFRVVCRGMADQVFMYGIVAGVFAVFTGILLGCRVKRHSGEPKTEKKEEHPI